jgi:hypothetical protein
MQQGLRPVSLQDENSVGAQRFGGNAGPVKETPLPSARKAFGNLQNRGNNNATEIGHPAKTPAPGTVSRRALGDITNASTKKQQQNASAAVAVKLGIFADVSCGVGPDQQQQDQQSARLDDLAKDEPERTLGKSWKELEADRISREDDDIADRLAGLGHAHASHTRFSSFFPWQAATASSLAYTSTQKYEAVSSPPSSPLLQKSRDLDFEKNVDDMLDLSSIELPDL